MCIFTPEINAGYRRLGVYTVRLSADSVELLASCNICRSNQVS